VTDVITEVETAAMPTLKGVHGTSRSAAQEIAQHQIFQKTDKGRVGTGVYFWRDNIYAKDLAICWYEYRVRKGDFKPNEGAVIYADICIKENEFWDLEEPSAKDDLGIFAIQQHDTDQLDDDARNTGAFYDLFIDRLEKNTNTKCKVFQIRLPSPPKCLSYPTTLLGNPLAYVVRDETCIHIDRIEEI